ncbi:DUF3164 family protein [uncultured Cohaesibacter sp.]|uniref:DUF3164 family protein n=1 Tax=uncultured Cohaesibacter sp. TaxID=1002546 RepID=UPI0029C7CB92|nr:DUF3164 family protein [uncultured Cohaesibacter sp.]
MNYQSEFKPAALPDGVEMLNGKEYMHDAKGNLRPAELVKPAHKLEDQTVRQIMGYAIALNEQMARFWMHTMDDLDTLDDLLAEQYGVTKGGPKGNRTYVSFDGLFKVTVKVNDLHDFGPQLDIAKKLFDECLNEWSADAHPAIRGIITQAFNTDKKGKINRTSLLSLMTYEVEDDRWMKAVDALRDAMRVIGSKEYVLFHRRKTVTDKWEPVSIDLAKV